MKEKSEQPSSQWHTLPWKKIQVGDADETGADSFDFDNEKNHYDDAHADPSDLYDAGANSRSGRYDPEAKIEGADDPGIFVGLEVIDGSQYQVEKITFSNGHRSGHITRLVVDKDKDKADKAVKADVLEKTSANEKKGKKSNKKQIKKESKKEGTKEQAQTPDASNNNEVGESKKLSRKQRNRQKYKEMIAERKAKRAEKKRKRDGESCSDEQTSKSQESKPQEKANNDAYEIPSSLSSSRNTKKKRKESKEADDENSNDIPIVNKEDIDMLQNSWAMNTGGVLLHEKICTALHGMEFNSPTPIQASTLAASILGQRDIVGAAPTGSVSNFILFNVSHI